MAGRFLLKSLQSCKKPEAKPLCEELNDCGDGERGIAEGKEGQPSYTKKNLKHSHTPKINQGEKGGRHKQCRIRRNKKQDNNAARQQEIQPGYLLGKVLFRQTHEKNSHIYKTCRR